MGDERVRPRLQVLTGHSTRRLFVLALAGVAGLQLGELTAKPAHRNKQRRNKHPLRSDASPAVQRELTCSDGTTFVGEQVRQGNATPATWRNVNPETFPGAFTIYAVTVTDPDGTVVEHSDHSQGVAQHHELITCSFIIPVGPFTGDRVDFLGFFVPAGRSD